MKKENPDRFQLSMKNNFEGLYRWIADTAVLIEADEDPEVHDGIPFLQEPELSIELINLIEKMSDEDTEKERAYYSACIFALDICVAQLQSATETNNKLAAKTLTQLMDYLAQTLNKSKHQLAFWLPILNAFYEVHVELTNKLQDAYFSLANDDDTVEEYEEINHIEAIRDMINELSHLSTFDIAENFFAQSYAMPPDFFVDLIVDLYSIREGQDIALLALLHPKADVRAMVISVFDQIIDSITLSPISLSRLQVIKQWYPIEYEEKFNYWLKKQRLKGVLYDLNKNSPLIQIKASEVDGSGAQGIFIHVKQPRKNQLCGLLFKYNIGIKDAWVTPILSVKDVKKYYKDAFDDSVTLRKVDLNYFQRIAEHFLAITIENGNIPDLHLLEIQELLGLHLVPRRLDVPELLNDLSVQISPFTPDTMSASLKRSKLWVKNKPFSESWFIENANIDKLVNRCSSFIDGVKICSIEEAISAVFSQEMEVHRQDWLFHFLWITLWLKCSARPNEKTWHDSFFITYAISKKVPLHEIPVMQEISQQTVFNSIETMKERRTYLHGE